MVWDALGSPEAEVTMRVAARMYKAITEEDVFAVLSEACEAVNGTVAVHGYAVAHNGRSIRHVAKARVPTGIFPLSAVKSWLLDGDDALPQVNDADGGIVVVGHRLTSEHRVVGGILMAGPQLDETDARRCAVFAGLAAGAIAGLRQKRLSHMVLEALEQSEEAISFYDQDEGVIFTNDAYHRVFPHYPGRQQLLGTSHLELYRMDLAADVIDDPLARRDPDAYLAERARRSHELIDHQREIQTISSRTYIYTRSRSKTGATMSRRIDITEQALVEARLRLRERELHDLAFQDPLTGLFNRAYLRDHLGYLQHVMAQEAIAGITVFLMDLNGFKIVNDTHGHDCGDTILKAVADRLSHELAGGEVAVRLGGDEFVVLLERMAEPSELANMACRIIALVSEPVQHGDLALRIGASIGIAQVSGKDSEVGSLLSDADLAMYEAKKEKPNGYRFFHPDMREAMMERLALVEDLRSALRMGQFEVNYQPQFATQSERLVGFEALARWRHPKRGFISPTTFIPIMEEYGLIETLGTWILETACAEAAKWPSDLRVAVNVSPLQVRSARFSLTLCQTLLRSGLEPHRLELEITESIFLAGGEQIRAELERWKALGVRIALDDFGCGYSGLSYLSAFPIDKIKIDRGFIGGFDPQQPHTTAGIILHAIIHLGRELGMTVTAEGVERADQLNYLRRQACTEVQGFLLGKPMPADQVNELLRKPQTYGSAA